MKRQSIFSASFSSTEIKRQRICSASFSSTEISNLPDDVVADILRRLPLKQMGQAKSVSKLWRFLIDELCIPRVTSAPLHSLIYDTVYFDANRNKRKRARQCWANVPSSPYHHKIQIALPLVNFLDCCNGLFLFFNSSAMNYCVCNPTTRQITTIPNSPGNHKPPKTASLIFHPPHHKLVYISPSKPSTSMNIFSPKTGKWEVHELGNLSITRRTPKHYIFLGKSLYRLSGTGYVFKFDVIDETGYKTINLPEVAKTTKDNVGCIGASQGSLHFSWADRKSKMMIWSLEVAETDPHWVLKHTISLTYFVKHPLCTNLRDPSLFNVFAFHPTTDDIFVGTAGKIFCYDLHSKRLDVLKVLRKDKRLYNPQDCIYLFSINMTPLDALMTP